jgi:hypothetical protein
MEVMTAGSARRIYRSEVCGPKVGVGKAFGWNPSISKCKWAFSSGTAYAIFILDVVQVARCLQFQPSGS